MKKKDFKIYDLLKKLLLSDSEIKTVLVPFMMIRELKVKLKSYMNNEMQDELNPKSNPFFKELFEVFNNLVEIFESLEKPVKPIIPKQKYKKLTEEIEEICKRLRY